MSQSFNSALQEPSPSPSISCQYGRGADSKHPHPTLSVLFPSQTPQSSIKALPPHSLLQSS